ncbi:MAG: PTS sugar transporter subunit IIC [Erysipelotrichaceae bacterium]|nr:PTS sugar transporter subunit IIC [Erysipelotrichaceae bacterium]MBR5049491.1 PTS sugar transporter subunit IIC [Erysipelotrichaceae bacterium]
MSITLVQGLMLALMSAICAVDKCTEAFFWFRPITTAFLSGVILGDVKLGLRCAAIAELAFTGLLTVGGTVPPDGLMAGIMTTVLAYLNPGLTPEAALSLAFPFALLMQWVGIIENTTFAGFMPVMEKQAYKADIKGLWRTLFTGVGITAIVYAIIVFLSTYAAQVPIRLFVENFPEWIVNGFTVAGGIMPAIGLAMLLRVMMTTENAPYLFIGFVVATFVEMGNVLPIAIVGAAIAYLGYLNAKKQAAQGGNEDDGI